MKALNLKSAVEHILRILTLIGFAEINKFRIPHSEFRIKCAIYGQLRILG
jgi:hypothetical protein